MSASAHPLNPGRHRPGPNDLRNGQLRRCKADGFGGGRAGRLKHPALIGVLANANVSWCSVTVNREVLQRLPGQAQDVENEIARVDRTLRLGRARR